MSRLRFGSVVPVLTKLTVGATWDPTTRGSGYAGGVAAPTNPASRSTANPWTIGKWWQKTYQRWTGGDFTLGVNAPAALTASVDFFAEGGQPINVSTQTLNTAANAYSGQIGSTVPLNQPGYHVTVDSAAMQTIITRVLGANGIGIATFYARINPAVSGMQARVIQIDVAYGAVTYDHVYDFGSGQTYANLQAAMTHAISTDNAKHPLFINHDATPEMSNLTVSAHTFDSWARITDATPWAGAWHRTTPVYPTTGGDNAPYWDLGNGWIEFYQTNLKMDNIAGILGYSGSVRWYSAKGCKIWDSQGYNSTHWNRDIRPTGLTGVGGQGGAMSWIDECAVDSIVQPFAGGVGTTNCWYLNCPNSFCTPGGTTAPNDSWLSTFVGRTYVNGLTKPDPAYLQDVFTVTRATGGGITSASVRYKLGAGGYMRLYENGSIIDQITIPTYSNQSYWNIEDITAWIRTHTGWSATDLAAITNVNSTQMFTPQFGVRGYKNLSATFPYNNGIYTDNGDGSISLNVLGNTGGFGTSYDWHWEIIQFNNGLVFRNVAVSHSQFSGIAGGNTIKDTSTTNTQDFGFWCNAIGANGPQYQGDGDLGGADNGYYSAIAYNSLTVDDTTDAGSVGMVSHASGVGGSTYTYAANFAGLLKNGDFTPGGTGAATLKNSYVRTIVTAPPTGINTAPSSGNVSLDVAGQGTGATAIFVSPLGTGGTAYDWRPTGALLSNLVPPLEKYDMEGNTWVTAGDSQGAMSKSATGMLPVPSGY